MTMDYYDVPGKPGGDWGGQTQFQKLYKMYPWNMLNYYYTAADWLLNYIYPSGLIESNGNFKRPPIDKYGRSFIPVWWLEKEIEYNIVKINYRRDALVHGCTKYLYGLYVEESFWILSRMPDYLYSS